MNDRPIITTKSGETADPIAFIKFKAKQVRESRMVKPVLAVTAMALGAYLGARQPMKQVARDVHTMADRTKRMDHNLFTFAARTMNHIDNEEDMRERLRDDLVRSHDMGLEFQYYPGLGIYYPNSDGNKLDEYYGSGKPTKK